MTRSYKAFVMAFLVAFVSVAAVAQVTSSANDVATPIEGKGHDYIKMLSETVNPSNGSVSLRIDLPVPESRGFTVPFAITYDSSTEHHLVPPNVDPAAGPIWTDNYSALSQGGWSYTIPQISWNEWDEPHPVFDGGPGYEHYANYPCRQSNGYMLRGIGGATYSLYMGGQYFDSVEPTGGCSSADNAGSPQARSNGDWADGVWGTLGTRGTDQFGTNLIDTRPQIAGDKHGYIYTFDNHSSFATNRPGVWPVTTLPVSIEDRNGNKFTFSMTDGGATRGAFTATDTNGRTMYSSTSEFGTTGTINVGGKPYTLGWTTQSATFDVDHIWVRSPPASGGEGCGQMHPSSDTATVISEIDLPRNTNGPQLSYQFYYGGNPYGLLSEITYPSGTWVRYTWKQSDTMSDAIVYSGWTCTRPWHNNCYAYGPVRDVCGQQYKSPVVASREVGLAGSSTPILTQTFSYSTSWDSSGVAWTSKTTSVTTTDNVTGRSTLTVYTYAPKYLSNQPFDQSSTPKQVAVEQSIDYYEGANTSSRRLRRVEKDWIDQYKLSSEKTTLENGTSSLKTYSYTGVMPSEVVEYDYNNSATPVRRTVTTYQSFSGTLGTLLDKPCWVTVYKGNGTADGDKVAETKYRYDGGTTTCGTPGTPNVTPVGGLDPDTHDETNFGARGNVTEVIRKCYPNCSDPAPTTRYAYDSTGQILSRIDPKWNQTQYSYADSYTSGTPAHATNAFVTTITHPPTDGGVLVEHFTYDYPTSQLSTRTDPNNQTTTYTYDDVFGRLTQIDAPGKAQTTFAYDDNQYSQYGNTPSVTTTKKITGSLDLVSTSATDGMGHVVRTIADSYPGGAMIVDMSYDGLGHLISASNPHRSGASADGWTTYDYDPLGRQTLLTHHPDNTTVQTQYADNLTTVIDETGRQRKSEVDALGRLVKVTEPNPSTGLLDSGSLITNYTYNALDNLESVLQNGSRPRSFTYDSLSQLRSASNPESGTISYDYDANGNLSTKTAPSPNDASSLTVATNYTYDSLNRLKTKQYSDSNTPSTCFQYDQSSSGSVTNSAGRLVHEWTQTGNCASEPPANAITKRSFQSYDEMGRVTAETQCTPFNCNVAGRSQYSITHGYDLLGNETLHTNGIGSISFTAEYNGANLLRSLSSSWNDPTHPETLFSAPDATAYGPAGLTDAVFGNSFNLHREYDARLRLASETDTGFLLTPGVPGSASFAITGSEQNVPVPTTSTGAVTISGSLQSTQKTTVNAASGTGNVVINGTLQSKQVVAQEAAAGSGSVSVSGSEQTWQTQTAAATQASGAVAINGTLQSKQVQTQAAIAGTGSVAISGSEQTWQTEATAATQASGSVTISGSAQSKQVKTANATSASTTFTIYNDSSAVYTEQCYMPYQTNCPTDYYNNATIYLDNQTTKYVNGGYGWATDVVVNNLASYLSSLNYNVSNRGNNTLFVTTKATGAAANHTIGYFCYYDSQHFSSCPVQISGSLTLTGGHDDVYTTVYDSGSTSITINGQTFSRAWDSGSTAASIAAGLASDINAASPYVSASVSGTTINLTSKQSGTISNYSLLTSTTFNTSNFTNSSFTTSSSGGSLTGGRNATYTTNYDSGTTTVVANGHPTSYAWSGSSSYTPDPSKIAAGVAQAINTDGGAAVSASASGNTVHLTARSTGTGSNFSLSSGTSSQRNSFSSAAGSGALSGGKDATYTTVYDSGTTAIAVNGQTFTTSWSGSGTSGSSIAAGLAGAINAGSSYTSASASGATVLLTSRQSGAGTNYSLSASSSYDSGNFGGASFATSPSGAALSGGKDATYRTDYDYGTTTVVAGGHATSYGWAGSSSYTPTPANIAAGMAQAINSDGAALVNASPSGNTLILTARTTGAATNYALSSSTTSQKGSFASTPGGGALAGGRDTGYNTVYDTGTTSIAVNGQAFSTSWSGSGTTSAGIASALAQAINAGSPYVNASASGTTVSFTSKQTGANTNYTLSAGSTYASGDFSGPSFSATPSGSSLTGGRDATVITVYDTGTVSLAVNGGSTSVSYGQGDSASSIASRLASAVGSCGGSALVSAAASGSTVNLTSCDKGTSVNYSLSAASSYDSSNFSSRSFTASPSGGAMTGGATNTVYDSGSLTLTINGVSGSTSYGQGATPTSVAAGLAAAFSGSSQVSVTTSGATLNIRSKAAGTGSNYSYSIISSYDTGHFSSASFPGTSGSLSGGQNEYKTRSGVYSYAVNYHGNGNVASASDSVMGAWSYPNDGYDALNRLTKAVSSSGPYSGITINWSYDAWGNRLEQRPSPDNGLVPVHWAHYDNTPGNPNNATNRVVSAPERPAGYDYSASGNVLNDGRNQYTYDAENRIVAEGPASGGVTTRYVYDAEGERVAKLNTSGAVLASYVLGLGGEQMTEMDANGNWAHTNVFAGGKLMATYDNQGLHFHATDWLDTRRIQTGYDGTLELAFRSLPYGDGLLTDAYASSGDTTEHHFTSKERDVETGNDYFLARYYASNAGRFLTPDWAALPTTVPYAVFGDPQTLNLYTYVENAPLNRIDADGHCTAVWDCTLAVGTAIVTGTTAAVEAVGAGAAVALGYLGIQAVVNPTSIERGGSTFGIGADGGTTAYVLRQQNAQATQQKGTGQEQQQQKANDEKPYQNTPENQERMKQGKAPVGKDGKPVELHSPTQTHKDQLQEMTQTDHRGGANFKKNHQNTGQQQSQVDRKEAARQRREHWKIQVYGQHK